MNNEIDIYEFRPPIETRKKTTIYQNRVFAIIVVLLVFTSGLITGGVVSYEIISSNIDNIHKEMQIQINNLQNTKDNVNFQNIVYNYNATSSLSKLYDTVRDSIVVISGTVIQNTFFGLQQGLVEGSGFVYNYKGKMVIITNYHVVKDATDIIITFKNGNSYKATLLGSDAYADLAILQSDAMQDEYKPIQIISSSTLKIGDPVVAIGNPFRLEGSMTTGIVSQLGRTLEESTAGSYAIANIIQTSAPINPGNSGGPLLNYLGQVIGITTAIYENSQGLGFAIPSDTILKEITSLVNTGYYDQHSWLGISGKDMTYDISKEMDVNITYGWLIAQVAPGGAADKAGLLGGTKNVLLDNQVVAIGGDIIVALDGNRIINGDELLAYLEEYTIAGQIINVSIIRGGETITIPIELAKRPLPTG